MSNYTDRLYIDSSDERNSVPPGSVGIGQPSQRQNTNFPQYADAWSSNDRESEQPQPHQASHNSIHDPQLSHQNHLNYPQSHTQLQPGRQHTHELQYSTDSLFQSHPSYIQQPPHQEPQYDQNSRNVAPKQHHDSQTHFQHNPQHNYDPAGQNHLHFSGYQFDSVATASESPAVFTPDLSEPFDYFSYPSKSDQTVERDQNDPQQTQELYSDLSRVPTKDSYQSNGTPSRDIYTQDIYAQETRHQSQLYRQGDPAQSQSQSQLLHGQPSQSQHFHGQLQQGQAQAGQSQPGQPQLTFHQPLPSPQPLKLRKARPKHSRHNSGVTKKHSISSLTGPPINSELYDPAVEGDVALSADFMKSLAPPPPPQRSRGGKKKPFFINLNNLSSGNLNLNVVSPRLTPGGRSTPGDRNTTPGLVSSKQFGQFNESSKHQLNESEDYRQELQINEDDLSLFEESTYSNITPSMKPPGTNDSGYFELGDLDNSSLVNVEKRLNSEQFLTPDLGHETLNSFFEIAGMGSNGSSLKSSNVSISSKAIGKTNCTNLNAQANTSTATNNTTATSHDEVQLDTFNFAGADLIGDILQYKTNDDYQDGRDSKLTKSASQDNHSRDEYRPALLFKDKIEDTDIHVKQEIIDHSSEANEQSNSSGSESDSETPELAGSERFPKRPKKKQKGATCSICEKYISRDISRHMRIHDQVGRFQCVYPKFMCNHKTQNFNRPYDYKKHLLHIHFKFDDPKGKTANTLTDKLPLMGTCIACGSRCTANDWLNLHVLTKNFAGRCASVTTQVKDLSVP